MVKAMVKRPKSSGAKRRARVTERRNPMNWPASDDDTFQLMPERTLVASGRVVAICPSCILYHNPAWQSHRNLDQLQSKGGARCGRPQKGELVLPALPVKGSVRGRRRSFTLLPEHCCK